jgi:hypothetical protein
MDRCIDGLVDGYVLSVCIHKAVGVEEQGNGNSYYVTPLAGDVKETTFRLLC